MSRHPAKKVAAAVAAVLQFLAESEAVSAVAPAAAPAALGPAPLPAGWGLAGRQESMALRDLWQRRIPRSW